MNIIIVMQDGKLATCGFPNLDIQHKTMYMTSVTNIIEGCSEVVVVNSGEVRRYYYVRSTVPAKRQIHYTLHSSTI
jgi:hypothetical protein